MTAFARSLIHRARALSTTDWEGEWRQGEPISYEAIPGDWHPCRLIPAEGRRLANLIPEEEARATLIYADDFLTSDDGVEVAAEEEASVWSLAGPPEAIRRGRATVGWRAALRRVAG